MSINHELIIPSIGSTGVYELRSPFNAKMMANERYTLQAVRRISDYVANNEDAYMDIYQPNGIGQEEYDQDSADNMYILSLQSGNGHWLYVPARYVVKYPITNGIPYRSFALSVALPLMPADRDYSFLDIAITNLIHDTLGVTPVVTQIETSKVILVDKAKHDIKRTERDAARQGTTTDRSRYMKAEQSLQEARAKILALETYIKERL
jgi:hypothetical protein